MLLTIDPGTNSPGIALFDGYALVHAERVHIPSAWGGLEDGERWLRVGTVVAMLAGQELRDRAADDQVPIDVIFERPQWYAKAKSKGDPNQLAGVAAVAAVAIGRLSRDFSLKVHSPKPADWTGQLPKKCYTCKANKKSCRVCQGSAWRTPRGARIRSRLTEAELALCPDQNDAIDAVGLGLWKLGRFTPHSALSNGRDGR